MMMATAAAVAAVIVVVINKILREYIVQESSYQAFQHDDRTAVATAVAAEFSIVNYDGLYIPCDV